MRNAIIASAVLALLAATGVARAESQEFNLPARTIAGDVPEASVQPGGEEADSHEALKPGWGGWGGPTVTLMFPNRSAFSPISDNLGIGSFPDYMVMVGGMGTAQIGPYFRIGGAGAGGSMFTDGNLLGFEREAIAFLGYGGLVLYGMYPLGEKLDVYGRVLLGAGGLNLVIKGEDLAESFEDSEAFFAWHPAIGVAYHPLRWMSVELEGGYFGMLLDDMTREGVTVFDGGAAGGPTVQLNIQFGAVVRKK